MLVDSTFNYDALVTAKKHIIAAVSSLKVIDSQESDNSSTFESDLLQMLNMKNRKGFFRLGRRSQLKRDGLNHRLKKRRNV